MYQKVFQSLLLFLFVIGLSCTPYPRLPRRSLPMLLAQVEPVVATRRFSRAIELLEEAAQIHPEAARPLVEIGQIYLSQHRWLPAEDAFNRALAREPNHPLAMAGLANALFNQKRLDEALTWWQQTVAVHPELPGAFTGLGRTYLWQFEFDLAKDAFRAQQAHHFDPHAAWYLAALTAPVNLPAAQEQLAAIGSPMLDSGRPAVDEELLTRRDYLVATLTPFTEESAQAAVAKATGVALAQVEQWPLAIYALTVAQETQKTADAETLAFLGHALAQVDRPAFDLFEAARQTDPTSALPLYFQALYLRRQGALRAAEDLLRQALDLDPQNLAVYIELAQTQIRQGNLAAAEAWYLAAVEAAEEGEVEWVQRLRLQFYVERGYRLAEAGIPTAEVLLELNPADAQLYDWLGWMQFLSGRPLEGEESLRQALELEPDLISARYHLARLLEADGRTDLAVIEYQRVIDWDTSGRFRQRALKDLQQL